MYYCVFQAERQNEADGRVPSCTVQPVHLARAGPAARRPGDESHRGRVPQPTPQVSLPGQLLHHRLVPGTRYKALSALQNSIE